MSIEMWTRIARTISIVCYMSVGWYMSRDEWVGVAAAMVAGIIAGGITELLLEAKAKREARS